MNRRQFISATAASFALSATERAKAAPSSQASHTVVIGGGVFGVWTAWKLLQSGQRVTLIEQHSPAHARASSGGESRVTRFGYGDDDLYAEWAFRSLVDWKQLSDQSGLPVFHQMGVLWLHQEGDRLVSASVDSLTRLGIPFELMTPKQLRARYPVASARDGEAGFLEPMGGGLMARRAVQTLAARAIEGGMTLIQGKVDPIRAAQGDDGALKRVVVATPSGEQIVKANQFVVACGPWLDNVCPDAMEGRLFVTRQEVFYFAADRAITGALPVWADLPFYGFPDLEGRGFKVANDTHGPLVNPDTQSRQVTAAEEERVRAFLASRFPAIADAPVTETRVCQYENSSNGDFVIDRHPGLENVLVVGGGSGHGFKHGPAVGSHVADLVLGRGEVISRFSLATKAAVQAREVH